LRNWFIRYYSRQKETQAMFLITAALFEPGTDFVRPIDVAEKLGVSRSTVTRWVRNGLLPGLRIAGTTRVHRATLEAIATAAARDASAILDNEDQSTEEGKD
jgi:excisionase family DNA binding protein